MTLGLLGCGDSTGMSTAGPPTTATTPTTPTTASTTGTATEATESTTVSGSETSGSTDEVKYDVGGQGTGSTSGTGSTGGLELGCNKVDILFVIDDSGSMSDEQDKLTQAFPSLVETIDQELVQEKDINYRIGVVSTDMAGPGMCVFPMAMLGCGQGHRGRLQHNADRLNCDPDAPPGKWIEQGPVNEVASQFQCIASMDGGEFDEMPLEAARAALVDRVIDDEGYNVGFMRDDALLVIVIFTDEDDQSVWEVAEEWPLIPGPGPKTPPIEYWNKFVDLKGGEPDRLVTVVFSGPKNNSCGDVQNNNGAIDAPRLHQLLELNLTNAYWGSICENDFTTPLQEALDVIEAVCEVFPPPV